MCKCILLEKRCFWFEAAMLECKSTCCCVLWPLEGSRGASRRDNAHLFPPVSTDVGAGNQQEGVFSVLSAVVMTV